MLFWSKVLWCNILTQILTGHCSRQPDCFCWQKVWRVNNLLYFYSPAIELLFAAIIVVKFHYTTALTLKDIAFMVVKEGKAPVVTKRMSLSRVTIGFQTEDRLILSASHCWHHWWLSLKTSSCWIQSLNNNKILFVFFFTNIWKELCFLYLSVHSISLIFLTWSNHNCWLLQVRENRKPTGKAASIKNSFAADKGANMKSCWTVRVQSSWIL